jgi:predicted DNA binding CopG/RHH family protein
MKKIHLDKEEQELFDGIEHGELRSVPSLKKEIRRAKLAAHNHLRKNKRVNIRISESVLEGIQEKAMENGIPYQTYMSSILYKFVTGKLAEKV